MRAIRFRTAEYISPENARYEHNIIALAEGLNELDIPFSSSSDYWPRVDGTFLLKKSVESDGEELSVISHESYPFSNPHFDFSRTVYIDSSDGWRTPSIESNFPAFKSILRSHYNSHYRYPSHTFPWAFGLTSRIIKAVEPLPQWKDRSDSVLFNFRAGHPLRESIAELLLPRIRDSFTVDPRTDSLETAEGTIDRHYWNLTGRRHYPSYYKRIGSAKVCAAFGGYFAPNISRSLNAATERLAYKYVFIRKLRTKTLMQWDSWRLWEAWAAGCVVLHVDFDAYGCVFPVQPENWVHYVGFDLDDLDAGINRFLSLSDEELRSIAEAGRSWALEQYSPKAVAKRFLHRLDLDE